MRFECGGSSTNECAAYWKIEEDSNGLWKVTKCSKTHTFHTGRDRIQPQKHEQSEVNLRSRGEIATPIKQFGWLEFSELRHIKNEVDKLKLVSVVFL